MPASLVPLVALLTVGSFAVAVLFIGRALLVRRADARATGGGGDLVSELLQNQPANEAAASQSWLGRTVTQSGIAVPLESAWLMVFGAAVLVGGALFLWRDSLFLAVIGGTVAAIIVMIVFYALWARRRAKIRQQLPDAMESLARSVRAGVTVDQAIARLGHDAFEPTRGEFRRVSRQMDLGLSLEAAARGLVRRTDLLEMRLLVTTLAVQRQAGGNLPLALERLAKVVRDRIIFTRQFRAATIAARISAIAMIIIAPAALIAITAIEPGYAQRFLEYPLGKYMLGIALGLELLGILWIVTLLRRET